MIIRVIEKRDLSVKSCFTVYSRLIVMLKSVLVFSRTLPAYRLTRRKQDDFSFFYRIYTGSPSPEVLDLKEPSNICRIGSVGTQFGTIAMSVWYRTKIFIDTQSNKSIIDLFKNDLVIPIRKLHSTAREGYYDRKDITEESGQEIVNELAKAALDDVTNSNVSLPRSFLPGSSPDFDPGPVWVTNDTILEKESIPELPSVGNINDAFRPMAAFAGFSSEESLLSVPELPSTPPLLSFLQEKIDESTMASPTDDNKKLEDYEMNTNSLLSENLEQAITTTIPKGFETLDFVDGAGEPTAQAVGFEDDYVLVEVRPAFAPSVGDVGTLYRECQNPPLLDMFKQNELSADADLTFAEKLKQYENDLAEFDGFFRNLEHLKVS